MTTISQFSLGMSNIFLLQGKKLVLVDTGSEGGAESFSTVCTRLGVPATEISLIVVTHGHVDHYTGAHAIKALTGAALMVHRAAGDILRYGRRPEMVPRNTLGQQLWAETQEHDPVPVVYPVEPDLLVEGAVDLHPYGIDAMMIPTPGHSPCSYSIFLDSGEAIVGDLILEDPLGGGPALAWFSDDVPALQKSIALVLSRASMIYSGHGGPFRPEEIRPLYEAEFGPLCKQN